jgi:uncharacterized alkaline shock family protein YloU
VSVAERTSTDASEQPRGRTTIADGVVAKLANLAARQVEEVVSLGGVLDSAISSVVARVRGDEHRTAGIGVDVGLRRAAVDLSVALRYPAPLEEVTERIRATVVERVEAITGLEVLEVNVTVTDLVLDEPERGASRPRVV